jgi:hypothetical protein
LAEIKIESYGIKIELENSETTSLINAWHEEEDNVQATMSLLERYGLGGTFTEPWRIMLSVISSWIVLNEHLIIHANRNKRGVILTIPWGSLPSLPMSL